MGRKSKQEKRLGVRVLYSWVSAWWRWMKALGSGLDCRRDAGADERVGASFESFSEP